MISLERSCLIIDEIGKKCSICGEFKVFSEFYSQNKTSKKGGYVYYSPYCKECSKNKADKWNRSHRDKRKQILRKYDSKEENRKKTRLWSKIRRENGSYKEWQNNNKEKIREYQSTRRKFKTHEINKEEWQECLNFFNNSCAYCGMTMGEHINEFNESLHKEHVIYNGNNGISNCVPACKRCNGSKFIFDMEKWYKSRNYFTNERLGNIKKWISDKEAK